MADTKRKSKLSLVDKHIERTAIEAQLARGVGLRRLEAKYGVSISALSRHRKRLRTNHPKTYEALQASSWKVTPEELQRVRAETAEGWIIQLRAQVDKLIGGQDQALDDQRYSSAAQLAGQAHVAMKMLGEATGNLTDGAARVNIQNNVTYTAEFHELRTTILNALRAYPDALHSVLRALKGEPEPNGGGRLATLPPPVVDAEACAA